MGVKEKKNNVKKKKEEKKKQKKRKRTKKKKMLKTSTSSVSFDILLDAANLSSGRRFGHEFDSCCFGSMGLSLFICCSTRDLKPSLSYFFLYFSCLFLSFLSLSFPFSFF